MCCDRLCNRCGLRSLRATTSQRREDDPMGRETERSDESSEGAGIGRHTATLPLSQHTQSTTNQRLQNNSGALKRTNFTKEDHLVAEILTAVHTPSLWQSAAQPSQTTPQHTYIVHTPTHMYKHTSNSSSVPVFQPKAPSIAEEAPSLAPTEEQSESKQLTAHTYEGMRH